MNNIIKKWQNSYSHRRPYDFPVVVYSTRAFDDVDVDLSDHNVGNFFWIVQNSDSDLVISCFIPILIGITRSWLLYFMVDS